MYVLGTFSIHTHTHTYTMCAHTHTHTHIYIYTCIQYETNTSVNVIYIYIYIYIYKHKLSAHNYSLHIRLTSFLRSFGHNFGRYLCSMIYPKPIHETCYVFFCDSYSFGSFEKEMKNSIIVSKAIIASIPFILLNISCDFQA